MVASLLLSAAPPAGGEESVVPVSLDQALDLAAAHHPELLSQRASLEAESARAAAIRRTAAPRLSVASAWTRSDTPAQVFAQKLNAGDFAETDFAIPRLNAPEALSHLSTALLAEMTVDAFGKVRAQAAAQSARERAGAAALEEAVQDVRLRVIQAYHQAALGDRVVLLAARALEGARAREADVEQRVEEGASLAADLLRVRARRRQREAELASSRAEARIALAVLSRILGADAGVVYRPTDPASAPPEAENDGAEWLSRALAARPTLRSAGERAQGLDWTLRAERRSFRPDLLVWGQIQDDRSGASSARSGAFGVQVRWSVLDPGRGRRVAAAAAEARSAEFLTRAAHDQVRLEVETAWQRAQAARQRQAAAAGGAEEGREALRVVHERRLQGMATLTDELETEAASLAAELEELRVAAEAAVAAAALRRAAGVL
jgi:outer membrane protein TolC